MQKQLKSVELFHKTFGHPVASEPTLIHRDRFFLRNDLMKEENEEYVEACDQENLVEVADALGDMLYILCGTILEHGMQHKIEEVFNEIQGSNMSKLGVDGNPVLRADGKILKGPGYYKPNISKIIYKEDIDDVDKVVIMGEE